MNSNTSLGIGFNLHTRQIRESIDLYRLIGELLFEGITSQRNRIHEYFDRSTESDLFNRTKKLLNEYLNIILKDDVKNQVLKLFEWKDLRLNEIYFGLYYDNVDKNTGINYFYYGYVNPTFYKAASLKSAVTSNYVLNLLNSKYPIMISMKEEIRNNMNDILNREERWNVIFT